MPSDTVAIFNFKICGPALKPATFIHTLSTILDISRSKPNTPKISPFQHIMYIEAADKNSELIAAHNYDLQATFNAYPGTTISPGSEFRPPTQLQWILGHHPFWPKLLQILTKGASYKFTNEPQIDDKLRQLKNDAILEYGNHSSAKKRPEALHEVSLKDAKYGYSFPITIDCARRLRNGRIGPLGVAQHTGITETGAIAVKDCLAHDQSFLLGFAPSLNDLVDESDQIDLVFGWCLGRLIHQVVALRLQFPSSRIFICKFD